MNIPTLNKVGLVHPIRFRPILKQRRWGGQRLGTVLNKSIGPDNNYAESWEVVDHGDDQSIINSDCELNGQTLQQLVKDHSDSVFGEGRSREQFPLLFKFLDANDRLSVQVHPNDEQAKLFDKTENGKTEAWYIIDAEPDSIIYTGLKTGIGRRELEQAIATGDFEDCLHAVHPKPGECYYIPAGTVHALGEGVLIAEVQQSSDITFRLFDWNWVDAKGQPRQLHIDEAISCIDFDAPAVTAAQVTSILESEDHQIHSHLECDFFRLMSHRIRQSVTISVDETCRVWMCVEGQGRLAFESTETEFSKGDSLLIPASCPEIQIVPNGDEDLVFLETVDFC